VTLSDIEVSNGAIDVGLLEFRLAMQMNEVLDVVYCQCGPTLNSNLQIFITWEKKFILCDFKV
jgi:hypothetical protein